MIWFLLTLFVIQNHWDDEFYIDRIPLERFLRIAFGINSYLTTTTTPI